MANTSSTVEHIERERVFAPCADGDHAECANRWTNREWYDSRNVRNIEIRQCACDCHHGSAQ